MAKILTVSRKSHHPIETLNKPSLMSHSYHESLVAQWQSTPADKQSYESTFQKRN